MLTGSQRRVHCSAIFVAAFIFRVQTWNGPPGCVVRGCLLSLSQLTVLFASISTTISLLRVRRGNRPTSCAAGDRCARLYNLCINVHVANLQRDGPPRCAPIMLPPMATRCALCDDFAAIRVLSPERKRTVQVCCPIALTRSQFMVFDVTSLADIANFRVRDGS